MATRTESTSAIIMISLLVGAFILATYELWQSPAPDIITGMLMWMFLGFLAFTIGSGEYLGAVLYKKNFQDEGGLTGVWLRKEEHGSGMETHYVATYKRYADFCNYDDFKEKGVGEAFMSMFARTRVIAYTDKASMFEEVQSYMSSTPEGCIKYRGLLRKGIRVLSPLGSLREMMRGLEDNISELQTKVMSSTAASEAVLQEQTKNINDAAVVIGNAVNNFDKLWQNTDDKKDKK